VYGLAVNDYFIWGPNALGAGLGVLQLVLITTLPAKAQHKAAGDKYVDA
jgi:hypothetical protein